MKCKENLRKYGSLKKDLELIYDHIAERIRKLVRARREVSKIIFKYRNGVIKTESENLL